MRANSALTAAIGIAAVAGLFGPEPSLAQQLAHAADDARGTCRYSGLQPGSSGYKACVNREIDARSDLMVLGDDTSGQNVAQSPQE